MGGRLNKHGKETYEGWREDKKTKRPPYPPPHPSGQEDQKTPLPTPPPPLPPPHPPLWGVYVEALTGFSPRYHADVLNNSLALPQLSPWKMAPAGEKVGGKEEPELPGLRPRSQPKVMPSPWLDPTFYFSWLALKILHSSIFHNVPLVVSEGIYSLGSSSFGS